jgi:hypothetical protein
VKTGFLIAAILFAELPLAACGKDEKDIDAFLMEPPGFLIMTARCTVCHNLDRIGEADYDRGGWEEAVDRMIEKGAQLNPEERQTLIDYLASIQTPRSKQHANK